MPTRRRLLATFGLAIAGLAGCSENPTQPPEDDPGPVDGTASPDAGTTRVGSPTATEETATPTETDTATDAPETGTQGETGTETGTETATPGTTTPRSELDLREANVVDVRFERREGTTYRFDVTLIHDDDGEDGYADWWQVEDTEGRRLGRRELTHAHGTREFTRSATMPIPEDVNCVVVRGHDQTHGYGGRVVLVNLESGETAGVRQEAEAIANAELATSCP
ncbi:hypothetical protein [Halogeometricum limi]|uniref:Uncharacterized protein n=1 Tax=Halogeometricum limi TaxID=555875 RepID=A0A1I6HWR6_9EURY|nr:hypothetical protein [Halogeometricum limi]SFR58885.1 hypothetical protein SAMN04488124_2547 [Halogeometricum limi]